MRSMQVAAFFVLCALALPTAAQVHKCKDASGKTTYTDAPCGAGQSGGLLERQRAQSVIYQERLQAAEAQDRKQMRRSAEQEREWAAQSQRALQYQAAPPVRHSGGDWAARKALENAATSASSIAKDGGRWDQAAEAQRKQERREEARRKAISNPPTSITNCNAGFCYDERGGVYHKAGPDFMTGPNGQACHRAGAMWNCN